MQQWEYKIVDFDPAKKIHIDILNGFGSDGWELCHVSEAQFIFKRSKDTDGWKSIPEQEIKIT
jgi:hypothetical protein